LNPNGGLNILSCNHVLANENLGAAGDVIVQPGTLDGGNSPGDDIAKLNRFPMINTAGGNVIDCAIAAVNNPADVVNSFKNDLMPPISGNHPAVGLLFAGGCNRTFMNPIDPVLQGLNVEFVNGPGATVTPTVGMNVEKVGRTTEYTTSSILEIDASVTVSYTAFNAGFIRQIATAWMSCPGDSGSVVCRGGDGGMIDNCSKSDGGCPSGGGCGSQRAAQSLVGADLSLDAAVEKEFRERYVQHTSMGRWAIDTYFRNESTVLRRFEGTRIDEEDGRLVRTLYDKYGERIRQGLLQPNRDERYFTPNELREIRELLPRAKKYLREDEARAADELFALLAPRAEGKTVKELLELLNDRELFSRVRKIVSGVQSIRTGKRHRGDDDDDDDD
jgi:hypothetical protein